MNGRDLKHLHDAPQRCRPCQLERTAFFAVPGSERHECLRRGFCVEEVREAELKNWAKQQNIPFPVGRITSDAESTRRQWGVCALPSLVLTDSNHIVRAEGFSVSELQKKINENNPL